MEAEYFSRLILVPIAIGRGKAGKTRRVERILFSRVTKMKKKHPYHDESMWKGAPSENFRKAEALRANMTEAEKLLWAQLQLAPFSKYKFRRQHPVQLFIVDFYCHKLKLVIEVDGGYHESEEQRSSDSERTETLQFNGLQVVRFTNEDVINKPEMVMEKINSKIAEIEKLQN